MPDQALPDRDWSELVEQVLADPKLTEAEAAFLETVPDLKTTQDEFLMVTDIAEKSLIRGGWNSANADFCRRPSLGPCLSL